LVDDSDVPSLVALLNKDTEDATAFRSQPVWLLLRTDLIIYIYLDGSMRFFFQLRPCLVIKNFQDSLSYRMFRHMHGALNINKKN